jgi:IclR family transcriptional regulator, acetate operon repressor
MAVKAIQAVDNALHVLEQLAIEQPAGVSELARITGLDKMAVQRVLVTLGQRGWIRQVDGSNGQWQLTAVPMRVGEQYAAALRVVGRDHLHRLAETSGETALLFRRERDRLVVVDGVDSTQLVRMSVPIGTEAPMLRGGGLDVFLSAEERRTLQPSSHPMAKAALDAAVANGYFVLDSMYPHASAIGAPLWSRSDSHRTVGGAVIVVGPRERVAAAGYDRLGPIVRDVAAAIRCCLTTSSRRSRRRGRETPC